MSDPRIRWISVSSFLTLFLIIELAVKIVLVCLLEDRPMSLFFLGVLFNLMIFV